MVLFPLHKRAENFCAGNTAAPVCPRSRWRKRWRKGNDHSSKKGILGGTFFINSDIFSAVFPLSAPVIPKDEGYCICRMCGWRAGEHLHVPGGESAGKREMVYSHTWKSRQVKKKREYPLHDRFKQVRIIFYIVLVDPAEGQCFDILMRL